MEYVNRIRGGQLPVPDSQRSTSEIVKEMIERDGSIQIGLGRGLINARALARYIQEATHNEYTFEALSSAIRRYPIRESGAKRIELARRVSYVVRLLARNDQRLLEDALIDPLLESPVRCGP